MVASCIAERNYRLLAAQHAMMRLRRLYQWRYFFSWVTIAASMRCKQDAVRSSLKHMMNRQLSAGWAAGGSC